MAKLTPADIARLSGDPSAATRADMAAKVAGVYQDATLTAGERAEAETVLMLMAQDAMAAVRQALAQHLKSAARLPDGLAMALAKDIDDVALPLLQESAAFSDAGLIEIVKSKAENKQLAIAGRKSVPDSVARALVDDGTTRVAAKLAGNEGAAMSEATAERLVDKHGNASVVQEKLAGRAKLPLRVLEKLYALASETIKEKLLARDDVTPDMAASLAINAREIATVGASRRSEEEDVAKLAAQSHATGRLDPGIVIRALCMGDIFLFERGLALRADMPIERARQLIYDPVGGLKYVYERAYMPPALYPAVKAALVVALETQYGVDPADRERFKRKMIERVLTKVDDADPDTADYLLARLTTITDTLAHAPH
jgi:uncharacterized protein (DUF2336 family)